MNDLDQTSQVSEYGVVEEVHYPLVHISGLPHIRVGELIEFDQGQKGQVLSFNRSQAKVMIFDPAPPQVNTECRHAQAQLSLTFTDSKEIFGKTINPLGKLIFPNQSQTSEGEVSCEIDIRPPSLDQRRQIKDSLFTGVTIVDLMMPISRGQRELVIGDRKTGKTSFLLNIAKTQAEQKKTVIIYALIGKKITDIKRLSTHFSQASFADKTIIVATNAQDPPSLISLTPFSAMSLAEYFRDQDKNVVVFLDDLSTHAKFYREIALLGRQFPGRDSYPGDMFYTHARLLERAGNFQTGNITCLPVAETTENDMTDFIVSNLISITDGHLLFDSGLTHQGYYPAVNTYLSVTRVGKQTQTSLARQANRELTALLNQYQKTKDVSHFGAELTEETKKLLNQGQNLRAFFIQPIDEIVPLPVQLAGVGLILCNQCPTEKPITKWREELITKYQTNKSYRKKLNNLAKINDWEKYKEKICKL